MNFQSLIYKVHLDVAGDWDDQELSSRAIVNLILTKSGMRKKSIYKTVKFIYILMNIIELSDHFRRVNSFKTYIWTNCSLFSVPNI